MNLHTRRRQALWDTEVARSLADDLGDFQICNLCFLPVLLSDRWDESHDGTPKAFGGKITGIAHAPCNRRHGASIVKPLVTKAKNIRARHTGSYRPRKAFGAGKDSGLKRKVGGEIVARISVTEQVRQTLEKRRIIAE
jgi:hypothetical protein